MVTWGIDVLQAQHFEPLKGKRVGLYTNFCAVNRDLMPTYRLLVDAPNVNLVAIFAPEHGLFAAEADGEKISSQRDEKDIPVYSLYGETYRPMKDSLDTIDVMVCDIPDLGVRYYTFLWTLTHILEACGEHGIPVIICDRPNPLGGNMVQGGPLEAGFASLVGRFDVPIRYGMTIAELALYINDLHNPYPANITVIACEDWSRDMNFWAWGLPFVPSSPNIPHYISVEHYTGACLIEGTNLSEGRGTAIPFEVCGAPYINGLVLADYLNMQNLEGVRFRPHSFKPLASKYQNQLCHGVHAHLIVPHRYDPLRTWLTVIRELRHIYSEQFAWLPPYKEHYHFDLLMGSDVPRQQIDAGATVDEIMAGWEAYCTEFKRKREPYLLYV
jgi:uncharacterized protein YbbC (DUF1343 family)